MTIMSTFQHILHKLVKGSKGAIHKLRKTGIAPLPHSQMRDLVSGFEPNSPQLEAMSEVRKAYFTDERVQRQGITLAAGDSRLTMSPMELKYLYGNPEVISPEGRSKIDSDASAGSIPTLQLKPQALKPFSESNSNRRLELVLGEEKVKQLTPDEKQSYKEVFDNGIPQLLQELPAMSEESELYLQFQVNNTEIHMNADEMEYLYGGGDWRYGGGGGQGGATRINLAGFPHGAPALFSLTNFDRSRFIGDQEGNIIESMDEKYEVKAEQNQEHRQELRIENKQALREEMVENKEWFNEQREDRKEFAAEHAEDLKEAAEHSAELRKKTAPRPKGM